MLTEVSNIPEKKAATDEKLKKEARNVAEKYYDDEQIEGIREGLWGVTVSKEDGLAQDKAIEVDKEFQRDGIAARYQTHKWCTQLRLHSNLLGHSGLWCRLGFRP